MIKTLFSALTILSCHCALQAQESGLSFPVIYLPADTSQKIFNTKEVDKAPEFPGGMDKMGVFISKNFHYPDSASMEGNIQSRIILHLIINADGVIAAVSVTNDVCAAFKNEAIKVVKKMPQWIPAEKNGKRVICEFYFPILVDPE